MDKGGFHYYLNWTKKLVAEMNAAIGCLHSNAEGLKAAECSQAERMLVGLRKMRDDFEQKGALAQLLGITSARRARPNVRPLRPSWQRM